MSDFDFLSIPETAATAVPVKAMDPAILPLYRIHGEGRGPWLFFAHANGLAAGSYLPFLQDLAKHLRVFAWDARGHGGSRWPEGPLDQVFGVGRFIGDLACIAGTIAETTRDEPVHFAGHSLGAAAALRRIALSGGPNWASMTLFEPPIFPSVEAPERAEAELKDGILIRRTPRRQAEWPSREAFRAYLAERGVFARFRPDMLAAHAAATLRPDGKGGFRLCCPPVVEAAIYESFSGADTWDLLPRVTRPIDFVGGDPDLPERGWIAGAIRSMAARCPKARLHVVDDTDHMLVCERPDRCRDVLMQVIEKSSI